MQLLQICFQKISKKTWEICKDIDNMKNVPHWRAVEIGKKYVEVQ